MKDMVKFTHNTFEYYELNISSHTQIEQINSKLLDFRNANHDADDVVVLSFQDDCEISYIEAVVSEAKKIAQKLNVTLHSIKSGLIKPDNFEGCGILGVPIIYLPLPVHKKAKPICNQTLTVNEPVRSGVRIHNEGDIIVTNFVSNGAEIIATGNIHVYGELRGKVVAGSCGDKLAKIFAAKFNPELISVGGVYRAIDTKLPDNLLNKFVVVSLDDKYRLNIAAVG